MITKDSERGHIQSIDGLRAFAVVAIIIYHLSANWLPAGFVGVDIFYVISGFVVAKSVENAPKQRLREFFLWFYKRRILRILPALIFFVLVTSIVCALFIPIAPVSKFIELTGFSALFGLSNFALLIKSGDYFAATSSFNPFTHTWSLAIEEQYYFLFPFFAYFYIVKDNSNVYYKKIAIFLVAFFSLISLGLCAFLSKKFVAFSFYMLPTRFWELALGFLTYAFYSNNGLNLNATASKAMNIPALAELAFCVLFACLFIIDEQKFPFPGAILPCLATAILILKLSTGENIVLKRVFSNEFVAYIGKVSYSLYLWHWGVIVIMRWTVGMESIRLKITAILLTVIFSLISYYLIERPIRFNARLSSSKFKAFYATACSSLLATACVIGFLFLAKPHIGLFASRDAQTWSPYSHSMPKKGDCLVDATTNSRDGGKLISFVPVACAKSRNLTIFVMGDSHAGGYERMLYRLAQQDGFAVKIFTHGGCKFILKFDTTLPPDCPIFRSRAFQQIRNEAKQGDVVFFAGLYTKRYRDSWNLQTLETSSIDIQSMPDDQFWAQQVSISLRPLIDRGVSIIFEAPKPRSH